MTQDQVDWEFAQIMQASGISDDEACLLATNAGEGTHLLHSTVSDETLACGVPTFATAYGIEFQYELLADSVISSLQHVGHVNCGLSQAMIEGVCLQFFDNWADQILAGSSAWFNAWLIGSPWTAPAGNPGGEPSVGSGTGVLPPTTDVPPAPAPVTEVDLIVQRIEEADPDIPTGAATDAAQRCQDEEIAAGDLSQPCLTEPIFFPGADAGPAAIHDATAIASHPSWFKLTYLNAAAKEDSGVPRKWYNRVEYSGICKPKPAERDVQCDEYPFYTTVEGGPGASLEEVPAQQNQNEGRALRAMQFDPECRMGTATGNKPYDFPGAGTQTFLVVPVAVEVGTTPDGMAMYAGPLSSHLCGSPVSGGGSGGGVLT